MHEVCHSTLNLNFKDSTGICSAHGTPQSLSFVHAGKLAFDDHARSALLPTYMADLSTSKSDADDLAMCVQHFFSEGT